MRDHAVDADRTCTGSYAIVDDGDRIGGSILRNAKKNTDAEYHSNAAAICPECGQRVGTMLVSYKRGTRRYRVHNTNRTFRLRSQRGLTAATGELE